MSWSIHNCCRWWPESTMYAINAFPLVAFALNSAWCYTPLLAHLDVCRPWVLCAVFVTCLCYQLLSGFHVQLGRKHAVDFVCYFRAV